MPSFDIDGVVLDLTPDEARVAQSCIEALTQGVIAFTGDPGKWDRRLQPALTADKLVPLFKELVAFLSQAAGLFTEAGRRFGGDTGQTSDPARDPALPLANLVHRYLDSVATGLGRLLDDWSRLGPLFFTTGEPPSLIAFEPTSLLGIVPLADALAQGGIPSLVLRFALQNAGGTQTASGAVSGQLVYLPRDVAADCALIGDTRRLCAATGASLPTTAPCGHPGCRSIAERINTAIGEQDAIPTFVVWPAQPSLGPLTGDAYGYREHITPDAVRQTGMPPDTAVVTSFFRTFGRHLGVAYAFCIPVLASDFVVHGQRPVWLDLSYAFEVPFPDLKATGMFAPGSGPLGARASVMTTPTALSIPAAPAGHVEAIGHGCLDVLEALAILADELTKRLQLGGDIITRYRPRALAAGRDRQEKILDLLATTSSWSGWGVLERLGADWRSEEDAAWTQYWFSLVLNEIKTRYPSGSNTIPQSARETIAAASDRVCALLGIAKFEDIKVSDFLDLSPADRETAWRELIGLATYLVGLQDGTGWDSGLETRWGALPTFALVRFELAEHLRARLPYFIRPLQGASLYFPEDGTEIGVQHIANPPPPRLRRDSYFPRAMVLEMEGRLALLQNAGVRARLLEEIGRLASE